MLIAIIPVEDETVIPVEYRYGQGSDETVIPVGDETQYGYPRSDGGTGVTGMYGLTGTASLTGYAAGAGIAVIAAGGAALERPPVGGAPAGPGTA